MDLLYLPICIRRKRIIKAQLFKEQGREINLVTQEACPVNVQTLLAIAVRTLHPSNLEIRESVAVSQRVLRQFYYNQGAVRI